MFRVYKVWGLGVRVCMGLQGRLKVLAFRISCVQSRLTSGLSVLGVFV